MDILHCVTASDSPSLSWEPRGIAAHFGSNPLYSTVSVTNYVNDPIPMIALDIDPFMEVDHRIAASC